VSEGLLWRKTIYSKSPFGRFRAEKQNRFEYCSVRTILKTKTAEAEKLRLSRQIEKQIKFLSYEKVIVVIVRSVPDGGIWSKRS
jgi:hypothetical protein